MSIRRCLKSLWQDERGQSTTEYILILSVVVMIAMKFRQSFSSSLSTLMSGLNNNLNSAIQQPDQ